MMWTHFEFGGSLYRTNADASIVERFDGPKLGWNRTYSSVVYSAARKALE